MIGVIADDLTGAAELGALGLRHGLSATIHLMGTLASGSGVESGALSIMNDENADLICLDTDSRNCPALEAAGRARVATQSLIAVGAGWIYKKVDSVLRGQITAELEATMEETACERALLLPANPRLGRVIRNGRYYIHGKPVNETDFARDATFPRTSAFVLEMLPPPGKQAMRVCHPDDTPPRTGIVIGEAGTETDLDRWAAGRRSGVLMAGGAEFFGALLRADGLGVKPLIADQSGRTTGGRELFVCGSNSSKTRAFRALSEAAKVPVFVLPEKLRSGMEFSTADHEELVRQAVKAFQTNHRVVIQVGLEHVADRAVAARLSSHLVRVAHEVLRLVAVDRVFAEGGATAVEFARTEGWSHLKVLREDSPGVATLGLPVGGPSELTIKPGSYDWPAAIARRQEVN